MLVLLTGNLFSEDVNMKTIQILQVRKKLVSSEVFTLNLAGFTYFRHNKELC